MGMTITTVLKYKRLTVIFTMIFVYFLTGCETEDVQFFYDGKILKLHPDISFVTGYDEYNNNLLIDIDYTIDVYIVNNTDKELLYGKIFEVQRLSENGDWQIVGEKLAFDLIGYTVPPKKIRLVQFNIKHSKEYLTTGSYRIVSEIDSAQEEILNDFGELITNYDSYALVAYFNIL